MAIDIPPFKTYVRSEYLYDFKEGFGYFVPATVIAISSYPGDYLSFHILADDDRIFDKIPIAALSNSKTAPKLSNDDVNITKCVDKDIVVYQIDYLLNLNLCKVLRQDGNLWQIGNYLFTIEWINTKQSVHLIELEEGNYILWPNELLSWNMEE